ncbi:hypothetical protein [Marinicella sp. W31]|uniref:hypothetical protein n=1 Tax=Marinicella sp. W31 TaxID=3023713 RepID=UPI003756EFA0
MKNNILGNGLLVLIGLLLLVAAIQMLGWGSEIDGIIPDESVAKAVPTIDLEAQGNANADEIAKPNSELMVQKDLFSVTRTAFVPPDIVDGEIGEDGGPEEEVNAEPLQARVTGIAITPEQSYVMIHDTVMNKNIRLTPGMPLEGDQGAWIVEDIQPRKVVFTAAGQEPQELELEVYSQSLKPVGKGKKNRGARNNNRKNNKQANNKNNNSEKAQQKNSAEEIRKKIAERRAQMRAEAARKKE